MAEAEPAESPATAADGETRIAFGRPLDDSGFPQRVFAVPPTADLLDHVFSINAKKTLLDVPILLPIAIQIALFFFSSLPKPFFLLSFLLWRAAYNAGLGIILKRQSAKSAFTNWFLENGLGMTGKELKEDTTLPAWKKKAISIFRSELEVHLQEVPGAPAKPPPADELAPEFKSWMAFRFLVDTILLNDFFAYIIMALTYFTWPAHFTLMDLGRYIAGILLIQFNVWVKFDAHRVVKDYAWYWGDFFFLPASSSSLTFDGVFELAPHPMYSIGYAGYYGISLLSGSYTVLFASLLAHAAQFAFLYFVEDPHIEKIYGGGGNRGNPSERELLRNYFRRDLVVFRNFDFFRSTDVFGLLIMAQTVVGSLLVLHYAPNPLPWLFFHAIVWRLLWTGGLGYMLHLQSTSSFWNRYWVKHGEGVAEGFAHWKSLYNLGMVQTYVTFWACAWGCYQFPGAADWMGGALLRHTLGALLVLLHVYAAVSIHETLGDFGWFFGDFFLPPKSGLKYSGIYRFLNNPEKVLGHSSFYAAAVITGSPAVFALALFSHLLSVLFLEYVERPHMLRVYGKQHVRQKGGAEKVILKEAKAALEKAPAPVKELVKNVETVGKDVFNETAARKFLMDSLPGLRNVIERAGTPSIEEDGLRRRRGRVNKEDGETVPGTPRNESAEATASNSPSGSPRQPSARLGGDLLDLAARMPRSASGRFSGLAELLPTKLIKEVLPPDIAGAFIPDDSLLPADLDPTPYSVTVLPSSSGGVFEFGEPIKIQFAAPTRTVTRKDWVGIYRVNENIRDKWTNRRSKDKWKWVTDSYEPPVDENGNEVSPAATAPGSPRPEAPQTGASTPATPLDRYWYDDNLEQEMCGGILHFEKGRIPWQEGVYEARYHYAGAYSVIVTSAPFEIRATRFDGDETSNEEIKAHLLPFVERAIQLPANTTLDDKAEIADLMPGDKGKREAMYLRIVTAIKLAFGVEFTWRVAELAGSVDNLAEKVKEGRQAMKLPRAGSDVFAGSSEQELQVDGEVADEQEEGADKTE